MPAEPWSQSGYAAHKDTLRDFLARQARLVDHAIHVLVTGEGMGKAAQLSASKDVVETVTLMMQGMGVSCHSIIRLTDDLGMSIRDCFGIARSICEVGINVAYIVAGGPEFARKARRHAIQKTYRDLNRVGALGGVQYSVRHIGQLPDPASFPELEQALNEFSDRRGSEKKAWTDDNLDARIKLIESRFGQTSINFIGAAFSIYRHASEILHGTYFGVVYFWSGGLKPVRSREEAEYLFLTSHLVSVCTATFFSLSGVVEVVSKQFGADELAGHNKELFQQFAHYVEHKLAHVAPPKRRGGTEAAFDGSVGR